MSPHATQRDDLTGEHELGDAGQITFFILFLTIWIADTFFLKYTIFLNYLIPYAIRGVFGFLLLIASGYFSLNGLKAVFIERRNPPEIINHGVFGIVRHPIYLGEILLYVALMFLSISIAAGLVLIAAVAFLVFISQYEEKLLLDRFGEKYSVYIQDVPMLFPTLNKK
jgi:protein-S-isoprenylcysteine O-methyltransferase Ste14